MDNMSSFYSAVPLRKRPQRSYSEDEETGYGSRGATNGQYSALGDSDTDLLQIQDSTSEVAAFLSNIKNQNAASSGEISIQAMSKALEQGQRYNILDIRELETKYGRNQVWKLQKCGEVAAIEIWGPHSVAKHVAEADGSVNPQKKALMLQLVLHYKGFTGSKERPERYNVDFLAC
jgi:hypothetical protein